MCRHVGRRGRRPLQSTPRTFRGPRPNGISMPMNHKVFLAQFDAIKKLASEGPCVMVGRCADYALSEYKDCF
ncbi:cytidylate kinase family protein, partial [Gemmiger formicilis]|uniref:cytidylate kinase family protein n=1 Tax=Gemmiger formicilis TaxID=745368 RepID=UPI003AB5CA93